MSPGDSHLLFAMVRRNKIWFMGNFLKDFIPQVISSILEHLTRDQGTYKRIETWIFHFIHIISMALNTYLVYTMFFTNFSYICNFFNA